MYWQDMNRAALNMIIDGGAVGIGVESTIVDVSSDIPIGFKAGSHHHGDAEGSAGRGGS